MTAAAASRELFRGRTVLAMILVGVLAFVALAVLSVYAPSLRSGDDGGGHALSKSAVGYAGAVQLFRSMGDVVVVSRGDSPAVERNGLLIVTPDPRHDAAALRQVRFNGPRLVVLPKWVTGPDPLRRGWVRESSIVPPGRIVRGGALKAYAGKVTLRRREGTESPVLSFRDGRSMAIAPLKSLQTLHGPGLEPLVTDGSGGIILARTVEADIYILSDPDLLNTKGLKALATARAAEAMIDEIRPVDGPLVFDVSLHGFKRSRNVFALALEPPFLGGTLCAVAAALLAGIAAAVRFGPVRRPKPPYAMGKAALVENTAGLIRMARREHRMAEGYARLCREFAARAVGAPRQLEPAELDAFLDRLSAQRAAPAFTDLIRAAREAGNLADLMAAARSLYDWRLEMTRASR